MSDHLTDLAGHIAKIQQYELSEEQWPITKNKLLENFSDDPIIKVVSQFSSLKNWSFELECFLTWMVFLSSDYPTQLDSIVPNNILRMDPVAYISFIEEIANEFQVNSNRQYKSIHTRNSHINNEIPAIIVSYRPGAAGNFIAGIIDAVISNRFNSELTITSEGEYKRTQLQKYQIGDFYTDLSIHNIVKVLSSTTTATLIAVTHIRDTALIRKYFPNSVIVSVSLQNEDDKLTAWISAMHKHALGVARWEGLEFAADRPKSKHQAIELLSAKMTSTNSLITELEKLSLQEQKDILMSELIETDEATIALNNEDAVDLLPRMYQLPYSCIRFEDAGQFVSVIDSIVPLSPSAEEFVRRNFHVYCQKQNQLVMRDPRQYSAKLQAIAFEFLSSCDSNKPTC